MVALSHLDPLAAFDDPTRPLVVLCSGNHLLTPKQDAEAHLARHLTRFANVLVVDPPVSTVGAARRPELAATLAGPRLHLVEPGLAHLVVLVAPKPYTPITLPLTAATARRAIRRAVDRLGGNSASSIAIVSTWPYCDVTNAVPGARLVYWRTDDPVAAATLWGLDDSMLRRGDDRMIKRCDLVATVDLEGAERLRTAGVTAHFLPNGCDTATMARTGAVARTTDIDLAPPIAGFVGLLNDRTDLSLLEAVADTGLSLLVVGPHQTGFADERVGSLRSRPNVRFAGPVAFDALPAVMDHIDIGLVPYADTPFNRASFPLKALEYLAAGRPVVGTDLPALRWLTNDIARSSSDPLADLRITDDPHRFVAAVIEVARLEASSHPRTEAIDRRRHIAARHDWSNRAALMAEWCGLVTPRAPHLGGADDLRYTARDGRRP